jgi:hypothetical protein
LSEKLFDAADRNSQQQMGVFQFYLPLHSVLKWLSNGRVKVRFIEEVKTMTAK